MKLAIRVTGVIREILSSYRPRQQVIRSPKKQEAEKDG